MSDFGSTSNAGSGGLGSSRGLGLGLGLGASRGLGLGLGLGLGNARGLGLGLGLGNGLGLGAGLGLGNGLGLGLGLGNGLGLGSTPYGEGGAIPEGADGGIGLIRSYYATPIELALLPWTLDFTPDNQGASPFPTDFLINPYQDNRPPLEWRTEDWDPALRFWTLPFDPHLTEWLRAADRSEPATLAALELAGQWQDWHPAANQPPNWLTGDLAWMDTNPNVFADVIKPELEMLVHYMEDSRQSYLVESDVQADGLPAYLIHFLGANAFDHPYTLKLIDVGLAMGNVVYMSYKAFYKRVRPSILCPGLTVPFGPPAHPAFPSGHSFLAHLLALFLLEIPGIYQRFGVLPETGDPATQPEPGDGILLTKPQFGVLDGTGVVQSPLLQVAHRIAVNRERIGVHYPSDSMGSRHLAGGLWEALMLEQIHCPTLMTILAHAKSEWPSPWPAD